MPNSPFEHFTAVSSIGDRLAFAFASVRFAAAPPQYRPPRPRVVYVSRRLGHASPSTTLTVYSHLWRDRSKDQQATNALEAVILGKPLENGGGERRQTDSPAHADNVAFLRASATGGD